MRDSLVVQLQIPLRNANNPNHYCYAFSQKCVVAKTSTYIFLSFFFYFSIPLVVFLLLLYEHEMTIITRLP